MRTCAGKIICSQHSPSGFQPLSHQMMKKQSNENLLYQPRMINRRVLCPQNPKSSPGGEESFSNANFDKTASDIPPETVCRCPDEMRRCCQPEPQEIDQIFLGHVHQLVSEVFQRKPAASLGSRSERKICTNPIGVVGVHTGYFLYPWPLKVLLRIRCASLLLTPHSAQGQSLRWGSLCCSNYQIYLA